VLFIVLSLSLPLIFFGNITTTVSNNTIFKSTNVSILITNFNTSSFGGAEDENNISNITIFIDAAAFILSPDPTTGITNSTNITGSNFTNSTSGNNLTFLWTIQGDTFTHHTNLTFEFTFNLTPLPDIEIANISITVLVINLTNNATLAYNDTFRVSVDTKNVSITLLTTNNTNSSSSNVRLNYTPSDMNIEGCDLYTNSTGAWVENNSNTTLLSGDLVTVNLTLPDGRYVWDVNCSDTVTPLHTRFNGSNFTLLIDTVNPAISYNLENNTNSTGTVTFNYTVADLSPNVCAIFTNASGSFALNSTINSTGTGLTAGDADIQDISFSDGDYIWNVKCNDSAGNVAFNETVNFTFIVDSVNPAVSFNLVNNSNFSGAVTFNYTVTDSHIFACSIFTNSTGSGFILNGTTNTTGTSLSADAPDTQTVTFADGVYIWNVNCTDAAGNEAFNDTTNFTVTVDTVTSALTNITNDSITSTSVRIRWNTSEPTNSTVYFGVVANELTLLQESRSFVEQHSINLTGLSSSTVYFYNVTSCDPSGNCNVTNSLSITDTTNTVSNSFLTLSTPISSDGGSGGGGGSCTTYPISFTSDSTAFSLKGCDKGVFNAGGAQYIIRVVKVVGTTATLSVGGGSVVTQTVTLKLGESTTLDLDGDSVNEFYIRLDKLLSYNKPSLTIRALTPQPLITVVDESDPIPDPQPVLEEDAPVVEDTTPVSDALTGSAVSDLATSGNAGWALAIGAVIVGLLALFFSAQAKKGKK